MIIDDKTPKQTVDDGQKTDSPKGKKKIIKKKKSKKIDLDAKFFVAIKDVNKLPEILYILNVFTGIHRTKTKLYSSHDVADRLLERRWYGTPLDKLVPTKRLREKVATILDGEKPMVTKSAKEIRVVLESTKDLMDFVNKIGGMGGVISEDGKHKYSALEIIRAINKRIDLSQNRIDENEKDEELFLPKNLGIEEIAQRHINEIKIDPKKVRDFRSIIMPEIHDTPMGEQLASVASAKDKDTGEADVQGNKAT